MDLTLHDISATNLLFGAGAFLALALPEGWELAPGQARPEIAACHVRGERRWVVAGDAWYVVRHTGRQVALELAIAIRASQYERPGEERMQVAEHWAAVRHWIRQRGFPRRWTVHFSEVRWRCEWTERNITITLSSRAPHAAFAEVLTGLEGVRCH
ncbi:MAG TPA: hypothetical protein VF909_20050 [Roseiflexaceae bacterium]